MKAHEIINYIQAIGVLAEVTETEKMDKLGIATNLASLPEDQIAVRGLQLIEGSETLFRMLLAPKSRRTQGAVLYDVSHHTRRQRTIHLRKDLLPVRVSYRLGPENETRHYRAGVQLPKPTMLDGNGELLIRELGTIAQLDVDHEPFTKENYHRVADLELLYIRLGSLCELAGLVPPRPNNNH